MMSNLRWRLGIAVVTSGLLISLFAGCSETPKESPHTDAAASTDSQSDAANVQAPSPANTDAPDNAPDNTQGRDAERVAEKTEDASPASEQTPLDPGGSASSPRDTPPPSDTKSSQPPESLPPPKPESIGDIVERLDDAVVFITVLDALGETASVGTGCIIDRSGLVATNYHVIDEAVNVQVQLKDGSRHDVSGYRIADKSRDLAILQVDDLPDSIEVFSLEQPPSLRQGDRLIAIGHPMEFSFTVSDGIVSAIRTTEQLPEIYQQGLHSSADTEWIQTTAAISNGSSGGPLLTETGALVGINTWIGGGQNLGFAINVKHLIALVEQSSAAVQDFPLPDSGVIVDAQVARLLNDYAKEYETMLSNAQVADSPEAVREIVANQNPVPIYLHKCAELFRAEGDTQRGVDAMILAHQIWASCEKSLEAGRRHLDDMYDIAAERVTDDARLQRIVIALGGAPYSEPLDRFLRNMFLNHPSRDVRGRAGFTLVASMLTAAESETYVPEMLEILQSVNRDYADVNYKDEPIGESAEKLQLRLESLVVGATPPNIEGTDLNGETFQLSDHHGKVVVVDFWADWCPHCRAMYEHERELVKRLEGRPFALLGVNCDEAPDRPRSLVENKIVTWRSWYDGNDGPIAKNWQVSSYPSVFVLDRRGRIRHHDVVGEDLEAAVEALFEEELLEIHGDIIPRDAEWSYVMNDSPPPPEWTQRDFDDSQWSKGTGPLGYGRDVQTTIKRPAGTTGTITAHFRHTFDVQDAAGMPRPLLRMRMDDGAVVYLNGTEVFRMNLPDDSQPDTPAIWHANDFPQYVSVDPQMLVDGRNVIAVEVHQAAEWSADLLFELTAGTKLPEAEPIFAAKSRITRRDFAQMLAKFTHEDPQIDQWLERLSRDEDPQVRVSADVSRLVRSAALNRPLPELPAPNDVNSRQIRNYMAIFINQRSWQILTRPGYSTSDCRRIADYMVAATALMQDERKESPGVYAALVNTLGVAQYRMGDYETALKSLEKSAKDQPDNPLALAYLAMAQQTLDRRDEAKQTFSKVQELMKKPRWLGDDDTVAAYEEASQMFAEP